jgi:hypothetical protein
VLAMLHARQDPAFGSSIALQLISDDHARHLLQPYAQLAEKSLGSMLVASALHEDIQYISLLIHRSPQRGSFATDREEDARPACHLSPQRGRRRRSSLADVCPNFRHH